jgi:WXG100 family type VII secretion target
MSGRFVVDLEQLDSVVSRLAAFEQKLERHITDVDARVERIHGVWSGDAAAANLAAHREWMVGAQEMAPLWLRSRRLPLQPTLIILPRSRRTSRCGRGLHETRRCRA